MWSVLIVTSFVLAKSSCDVLHFLQPTVLLDPPLYHHHQTGDYNYFENEVNLQQIPVSTESIPSLPEIIINKSGDKSTFSGYNYDKPTSGPVQNPIQIPQSDEGSDDTIVVDNVYLPPSTEPPSAYLPPANHKPNFKQRDRGINFKSYYNYPRPSETPSIQFDEPFLDTSYLPPVIGPPLNTYLPPLLTRTINKTIHDNDFFQTSSNKSPLRLELVEMRCLQNGVGGLFYSRITVQSFLESKPVFEDAPNCNKLEVIRNQIQIELGSGDFSNCGVSVCGQKNEELCLRLRFPQIRGMKTINDPILVLQCKAQERIVSKTHALRMGIASDSQARSSSTVAQGGADAKFRTQIGIFRRNGDSFSRTLEPNGIVQLGEDLMLRTQARQGDGWNFTKISDISMQRIGQNGEVLKSINLVSNAGCLNPAMKSICPFPPIFEAPMGHRFGFKAIMFQGMSSGDEIVMGIRIVGCINPVDCQQGICDLARTRSRIRRGSHSELSELASISFRVQAPDQEIPIETPAIFIWSCVGIGLGFIGLIFLLFMALYHYRGKYM